MNETSQNPYIGSNEETSLPSNTKKNTSKQIDPKGDYFGLKTDPDERFNQQKQHMLMHRTVTQINMLKLKAYLRNEEDMAEDFDSSINKRPIIYRNKG